MGDIGDGHADLPSAILKWLGKHSIIEIAGIRPVDSHEWQVTKVSASTNFWHLHVISFCNNLFREDTRNVEFGQRQRTERAW